MRYTFRRQKALVLVKSNSYFYTNLYDNSWRNNKRSTDMMGLGLDEIEEIIALRPFLETAKDRINEEGT